MIHSLCETCQHMRAVVTPKGSRFLLCEQSVSDAHYPKYPPQPVVQCAGYVPIDRSQKREDP